VSQQGQPVPPLLRLPFIVKGTETLTTTAIGFLTQLFNGVFGSTGIQTSLATIFGMHGDGTLSEEGVLTVTSSNGQDFVASAFTDTTDASNITSGALDQVRIANLSNAVNVSALPAPAAGLRAFVNDSTVVGATNFGVAVVGGGGFNVPVYSDGATWFIG
jgi:hypothetical protein